MENDVFYTLCPERHSEVDDMMLQRYVENHWFPPCDRYTLDADDSEVIHLAQNWLSVDAFIAFTCTDANMIAQHERASRFADLDTFRDWVVLRARAIVTLLLQRSFMRKLSHQSQEEVLLFASFIVSQFLRVLEVPAERYDMPSIHDRYGYQCRLLVAAMGVAYDFYRERKIAAPPVVPHEVVLDSTGASIEEVPLVDITAVVSQPEKSCDQFASLPLSPSDLVSSSDHIQLPFFYSTVNNA